MRSLSGNRFHEESESLTSFAIGASPATHWPSGGRTVQGKVSGGLRRPSASSEFWRQATAPPADQPQTAPRHPERPHQPRLGGRRSGLDDRQPHPCDDRRYRELFGSLFHESLPEEISFLRGHGLRIALAAHGSEVRDPDAHVEWFPESFFNYVDSDWRELLGSIAAKNRRIAAEFDGPLFVSTPDLRNDLPGATWLPVTIDYKDWAAIPTTEPRKVPRVLHRPSHLRPVKGTETIVPVLQRLHDRGVIEYLPDTGLVSASEMRDQVAGCDIVVDQIRTGATELPQPRRWQLVGLWSGTSPEYAVSSRTTFLSSMHHRTTLKP